MKKYKGAIYLLLAAFLYGIMPVMIRLLGAKGVTPIAQTFTRYCFALLAASFYFFVIRKAKFKVNKKDYVKIGAATVFGYSLTNLFFTYAILNTQIGNALFLFYSYAIIAPMLGVFFLKEKFNKYTIIVLVLGLVALSLLFQPNSIPTWKIGGMFALFASLCQAAYLILRRKLLQYPAHFMLFANTLVGVIFMGLLTIIFEPDFIRYGIFHVSMQLWIVTALFGFDNFLAWYFMTKGFELYKSTFGSVILLIENVFAIIFGLAFLHEVPTTMVMFGGGLLITLAVLAIFKAES